MVKYYKEKNFIVAFDPNETNKCRGKWDITTGRFYGVRGTITKTIPKAMDSDALWSIYHGQHGYECLSSAIYNAMRIFQEYHHNGYPLSIANRLEQLISLDLIVNVSYDTWEFMKEDTLPLTKEVVSYLKDNCDNRYSRDSIRNYRFLHEHVAFANRCGEHKDYAMGALKEYLEYASPDDYEDDDTYERYLNCNHDYMQYIEIVKSMIYYAVSEHLYHSEDEEDLGRLIFDMIRNMLIVGHKVEAKRWVMSNSIFYASLREDYENAHYDEILREHADMPWLYYENDKYIVRPLISRSDFHKEATAQHNCVESMYLERVFNGHTHVVTIRKKSDPNHSYITCEVTNKHDIRQYLLQYNSRPTDKDDMHFFDEYFHHLQSSL